MKHLISCVFLLMALHSFSQELTLQECLEKSRLNYPLINDFQNLDQQLQHKLKTITTNYYPKLDLTGQYTWQNDVPGFDSPLPGMDIPQAPKEQYKAFVDVKQVIYDGGLTKSAKSAEEKKFLAEKQGVEVELFTVRSRVIETFYLLLLMDEQIKQLNALHEVHKQRLAELKVAVANGVVLNSEAQQFEVELLKLEQEQAGLAEGRTATQEVLKQLVGSGLDLTRLPELPVVPSNVNVSRPEYALFSSSQEQLLALQDLKLASRRPTLAGFGQFGYGNPGYNLLKNELAPFYMVGVRLSWTIFDWKANANERSVLALQSQRIEHQKAAFNQQLSMAEEKILAEIRQLEKVIEKDDAIVQLRQSIAKAKLSQLNNGTITAAEYIREQNAEAMSVMARNIHLIELSKARIELAELGARPESEFEE